MELSLFDTFILEHRDSFKDEIKEISSRISQIGKTTGARENFFKPEGDSKFRNRYGDLIYALYDTKKSKLRLYCIRLSNVVVILGGGGHKPKSIQKWQDDEKLSEKVNEIMRYASCISKQIDEGDLYWSEDKCKLRGNFRKFDYE